MGSGRISIGLHQRRQKPNFGVQCAGYRTRGAREKSPHAVERPRYFRKLGGGQKGIRPEPRRGTRAGRDFADRQTKRERPDACERSTRLAVRRSPATAIGINPSRGLAHQFCLALESARFFTEARGTQHHYVKGAGQYVGFNRLSPGAVRGLRGNEALPREIARLANCVQIRTRHGRDFGKTKNSNQGGSAACNDNVGAGQRARIPGSGRGQVAAMNATAPSRKIDGDRDRRRRTVGPCPAAFRRRGSQLGFGLIPALEPLRRGVSNTSEVIWKQIFSCYAQPSGESLGRLSPKSDE